MTREHARMADEALEAGTEALLLGRWEDARAWFEQAQRSEDCPEAAEGIALAAWYLEDGVRAIESHERAYLLYRKHGDNRSAGRVASWLGWHYRLFHNDLATANGWLRRAHRFLDDLPVCVEQGQLALRDGFNTFAMNGDANAAGLLGERATAIGRACQDYG